ncbi:MAG: outer membrane beta-barrel protein [Bacteriovoracia bacterium]
MDGRTARFLILLLSLTIPSFAHAAQIELSGLVAYSKSHFNDGYDSMQRRYTASVSFKFTAISALEFEYADSVSKVSYETNVGGALKYNTPVAYTYKDKVYSFNWVQNLVPSKWIIQPYFVLGGGKMQRRAKEEYPEIGYSNTVTQNVTSGTGGGGLRIFLTRNMAIKLEARTYVPNFNFKKWKENQMTSAGLSWLF